MYLLYLHWAQPLHAEQTFQDAGSTDEAGYTLQFTRGCADTRGAHVQTGAAAQGTVAFTAWSLLNVESTLSILVFDNYVTPA